MKSAPRYRPMNRWLPGLPACALIAALWIHAGRVGAAAEAEPKADKPAPASSLDDALLDDLDNELLEGVGNLKDKGTADKPTGARSGGKSSTTGGDAEVIDDTMPAEDADPLVRVSHEMRGVEELIPKRDGRPHAEQLQELIVDELARLIEQAEQQRAQQSSSGSKGKQQRSAAKRQSVQQPRQSAGNGGKNSSKPAQDSTNRLGSADPVRVDPELFKAMMKDTWGHLPERDREQVLQNTPDKFLPQYELMIERYFERLAEDPDSR
jgi:hypothetical protein